MRFPYGVVVRAGCRLTRANLLILTLCLLVAGCAEQAPRPPGPSLDAPNPDNPCFLKVDSETWRRIQPFYFADNFEVRALQERGTITPLGSGWTALWQEGEETSGADYWIQTGDAIVRVNACEVKQIIRVLPSGAVSTNPYLDIGYASIVDLVLSGDRRAVRKHVSEIEVRRNGRTLIFRPGKSRST